MKIYRYNALTQDGTLVQGEMQASDASIAIAHLHAQALLPIDAIEAGKIAGSGPIHVVLARTGPLPGRDLAMISQQLARLLKAGLPLDRALAILIDLTETKRVRRALQGGLEKVRDGAALADALAAQGEIFPPTFLTLVRAGELSGALPGVLAETSIFLARSDAMRQKIVSAMVYPAILVVVASLSVGVILTAVLPQFEPMFKEAGANLPIATQIVVAAGDALRAYWWVLILCAIAGGTVLRAVLRSQAGRAALDRLLLRVPLLRHLVIRFEIGRFCRTLGVMLASGVAAPAALALAASTMGNAVLVHAADDAATRFREGEGLSAPLARSGRVPAMAIQLIRIGEETGRLEDMLGEVATLFDQDVQRMLERMLAALLPLMTLVMGLLIALIVGAVLTALMSVNALAV